MTADNMTATPTTPMVQAIEALHRGHAREQAAAHSRWRRNVEAAARAGGQLPATAVAEVAADAKTLGFSPEEFEADVHTVMEDISLTAAVDAASSDLLAAAGFAEKLRLEADLLQADYLRERGERDAAVAAIEGKLRDKRRALSQAEADVTRRTSATTRAHEAQLKHRTARGRQRVF
jgi:hypothetical protein